MIQSDELRLKGIEHAYFTREGGVSTGLYSGLNAGLGSRDDREAVLKNRALAAAHFSRKPHDLVTPYQIHSDRVLTVTGPFADGADREADALVTDRPGIVLGIVTADCGPVLFADPTARVIGAAHAGWKGAVGGVLENTIAAMETLGASRDRITAVLGPTISQVSYEVGPEFQQNFLARSSDYERYFDPSEREDHLMFNLPAFIVDRLRDAGIGSAGNLALCTYQDEDRFYSYRRTTHRKEEDYGRLLSAIGLTEA